MRLKNILEGDKGVSVKHISVRKKCNEALIDNYEVCETRNQYFGVIHF